MHSYVYIYILIVYLHVYFLFIVNLFALLFVYMFFVYSLFTLFTYFYNSSAFIYELLIDVLFAVYSFTYCLLFDSFLIHRLLNLCSHLFIFYLYFLSCFLTAIITTLFICFFDITRFLQSYRL